MKPSIPAKMIPMLATMAVMAALYGIGVWKYHDPRGKNFADLYNFTSMLKDATPIGIAAIGATFVILSGGIDLSIGSVVAFTAMFMADKIMNSAMHPVMVIPLVLLMGTVLGILMGCAIHFYRIPAFMVTLAGMFMMRGLTYLISTSSVSIDNGMFQYTKQHLQLALGPARPIPGLRFETLVFLGLMAAAIFVSHFTRFGRAIYAMGDDETSAALMGVRIGRTKIAVYGIAGFCSALAGVAVVFSGGAGDPNGAVGWELQAIAAVVIGGTLLTGGVGYVAGTFMGVIILRLIQKHLEFLGGHLWIPIWKKELNVDSAWTMIIVGALLFTFILLQSIIVAAARRATALARQKSAGVLAKP